MPDSFNETMRFQIGSVPSITAREVLLSVYSAMNERGYDPINQIVGYIISGDPTYITSHNNARHLIRRVERDELLEELVRYYVQSNTDN